MRMRIQRQELVRASTYMGVTTRTCALCGHNDRGKGRAKLEHDPVCMLANRGATHVSVHHIQAVPVMLKVVGPGQYSWRSSVSGMAYVVSRCDDKRFVLVCSGTAEVVAGGRLKEIREFIKNNQGVL